MHLAEPRARHRGKLAHHVRAMRLAIASYERYDLERYRLRKMRGETGVRVEAYDGGDVGW